MEPPQNHEPLPDDGPSPGIVPERKDVVPMIGLGGSAGSLAALREFFQAMPADSGLVFVVVVHLSPQHDSMLAEILQHSTKMRVVQAENGQKTEPNCVYVIPPGKHLTASNGVLHLGDLQPIRGKRVAVDLFLRTLADTHGARAAAIILSGTESDGAIGIKRIKERGGLTVVQDPREAESPGMPRAAIASGMIDWVSKVGEIPERLVNYWKLEHRLRLPPEEGPSPAQSAAPIAEQDEKALRDVLGYIRTLTGRDFNYYKRPTIVRRLGRRMQVNGLEDVPQYLDFLHSHPGEATALVQELLVSVTNFFRDREAFQALTAAIPDLFHGKGPTDTVRVWVAACATGEEAYSLAMLLSEHARSLQQAPKLQIFATDLDEDAIRSARDGLYPETIAADVSEERLGRFFVHEPKGYRVGNEIREMVLFALHDLLRDAPFSKLDLVCCRNLMIYLNREAKVRVLEICHFALRPEGRLFLGSSESVDDCAALFNPLDKKARIYQRRQVSAGGFPVPSGWSALGRALESRQPRDRAATAFRPDGGETRGGAWAELHWKLLERASPPSVLVNRDHEIMHLSENAGRYFQIAAGEPTRDVFRSIHPMLRLELRGAFSRAKQSGEPAEANQVPWDVAGIRQLVTLRVFPGTDVAPEFLLVMFHAEGDAGPVPVRPGGSGDTVTQQLERELDQAQGQIREVAAQYEASSEELKASNEELQAMNEELRSATEELETSREELQSINEELTTVNQELKTKVDELGQSNGDLQNLVSATAIATLFLDRELNITRFTPSAVPLFSLIPTDVGRPVSDLNHRLEYPHMLRDLQRVLAESKPVESEVGERGGRWFLARFLPYQSAQGGAEGVVLTFVDVTARRRAEEALRTSENRLRQILDLSPAGIYTCDLEGRITFFTPHAAKLWGRNPVLGEKDIVAQSTVRRVDGTQLTAAESPMARALLYGESARDLEAVIDQPSGAQLVVSLNIDPIAGPEGKRVGAINVFQDITAWKRAERRVVAALDSLEMRVNERTAELKGTNVSLLAEIAERKRTELERMSVLALLVNAQEEERRRISRGLHDEVGQQISALLLGLSALDRSFGQLPGGEALPGLQSLANGVGRAVHELAVELRPTALDDLGLLRALGNYVEEWSAQSQVPVDLHSVGFEKERLPSPIETTLYRLVGEGLNNVAKHARAKRVSVILERQPNLATVIIEDDGVGFDPDAVEPGLAGKRIGLGYMRERAALVGGQIEIESAPNRGTTLFVKVPLPVSLNQPS